MPAQISAPGQFQHNTATAVNWNRGAAGIVDAHRVTELAGCDNHVLGGAADAHQHQHQPPPRVSPSNVAIQVAKQRNPKALDTK